MHQNDLNRAVARATGESVSTVKRLGFLLAEPANDLEADSSQLGPHVIDWDALDPGPIRRIQDMPAGGDRLVADAPGGMDHILVNGVPIRENGSPVADALEELPGEILRS